MDRTRRAVLAGLGSATLAGCVGDDSGASTSPTATDTGAPETPRDCDPADASRPPIVEDTNHPGKGYGTKPDSLTTQSVADYLADFETGFSWNRLLADHDSLTSIGVNTLTPWEPEGQGTGFVAWSRIRTSYSTDPDEEPIERTFVANYYVSPKPVYRVETESDPVAAQTHPDRQLVQCGADTTK